jgi:2,4-dienoyl-CoA reductase (NADPH2)
MSAYTQLFTPLHVGGVTLKNRVIMGSMHTGLEEKHMPELAAFYAERAMHDVGLIVTGGFAPNRAGRLAPFAAKMTNKKEMREHTLLTDAVHAKGGKIALQILHAGRYGYHPFCVSSSRIKSPISPFKPWKLTSCGVKRTIGHYVRAAKLAKDAGYDGVEVMGSEGYLITQFLTAHVNKRKDQWGGSYENRMRFPLEIVKGIRKKLGDDFLIIFRISLLDLVKAGSSWDEIIMLAQALEAAGVSILSMGIGWHEARVPTIATMVPRAEFASLGKKLKASVTVPVIVSNRINTPEVAEQLLRDGMADMVSMARPFLADPQFVSKAKAGLPDTINTCIACNQACLDHVFKNKRASCLVNPRACFETSMPINNATHQKSIAVVGAGPAGMAFSAMAARRGHKVTLFDKASDIGGQFNLAKTIPGKEEFYETLRYFSHELASQAVDLRLDTPVLADDLMDFDEIVLATGVSPRTPEIEGVNHASVISYFDLLSTGVKPSGKHIAIIGGGGIGFDVAAFLLQQAGQTKEQFAGNWGVDLSMGARAGLVKPAEHGTPAYKITMLQRKTTRMGRGLGKTTGWAHRAELKRSGVKMLTGVTYQKIDDAGLHVLMDEKPCTIAVDHIIICAGQNSRRDLQAPLESAGKSVHLIGGADVAMELDAKRAIKQAVTQALSI